MTSQVFPPRLVLILVMISATGVHAQGATDPSTMLLVDGTGEAVGPVIDVHTNGLGVEVVTAALFVDGHPTFVQAIPLGGILFSTASSDYLVGYESADCSGSPYLFSVSSSDPLTFTQQALTNSPQATFWRPVSGAVPTAVFLTHFLDLSGFCATLDNPINTTDALAAEPQPTSLVPPYSLAPSWQSSSVVSVPAVSLPGLFGLALALLAGGIVVLKSRASL